MHVRKGQVLLPVEGRNLVFAGVRVKSDRVKNRLIEGRHPVGIQSALSQQLVDRSGSYGREKFSLRVRPLIFTARTQVHGAGSYERDKFVLVGRHSIHVILVLLIVPAE